MVLCCWGYGLGDTRRLGDPLWGNMFSLGKGCRGRCLLRRRSRQGYRFENSRRFRSLVRPAQMLCLELVSVKPIPDQLLDNRGHLHLALDEGMAESVEKLRVDTKRG